MIDAVGKLTESLRNRVQLMVGRAIIRAVTDTSAIQRAQVELLADEVLDNAERIQQYGHSSVPLPGAEAVIVFVGGNRDHPLIIATDDRLHRAKGLEPGESVLYDDQGQKIHITRGGIVIDGAGKPITIQNAPTVMIKASTNVRIEAPVLECTGDIKDRCDAVGAKTMADMRSTYNGHTHPETPLPGPTSIPNQAM